jgi:hypothetical protein
MSDFSSYDVVYFPSQEVVPNYVLHTYSSVNHAMQSQYADSLPYHESHIAASKSLIVESSTGLQGRAAVINSGDEVEVPLTGLAMQFEDISIYALDESSARATVETLPDPLQPKHHIVVEDMSGIIKPLAWLIDSESQANDNGPDRFVRNVTEGILNLAIKPYVPAQRFDFVCSSLVGSQSIAFAYEYMRKIAAQAFEMQDVSRVSSSKGLLKAFADLALRVRSNHVEQLAQMVSQDGVIYLGDVTHEIPMGRDPFDQKVYYSEKARPVIDIAKWTEVVTQKFDIIIDRDWVWHRLPPPQAYLKSTAGSTFIFKGFTLSAK